MGARGRFGGNLVAVGRGQELHSVQHHPLGIWLDSTACKRFTQLDLVVLHVTVGLRNAKIEPPDFAKHASDVAGASSRIEVMAAELRTLAGGASTERTVVEDVGAGANDERRRIGRPETRIHRDLRQRSINQIASAWERMSVTK
jgi:hypothetical protein